jgi:aminoglycoside 6'-N-acetyltransferase I
LVATIKWAYPTLLQQGLRDCRKPALIVHVIDLRSLEYKYVQEAATLLVSAFAEEWSETWPTIKQARNELEDSLGENHICWVTISESSELIGLVWGSAEYDGHAWELHPLVVYPDHRKKGIGSQLIRDFKNLVRASGATTIYLGTDDESGMTSLSSIDLYQDLFNALVSI